ncbi:MAG: hypothetical protein CMD92_05450 [Gammaproteobacteria bacterium]|nr:hypothetical protein [Gammaproteobacteria bacterium]HBW83344.1 hypothetical protein [Gammaproteobacteria bacterium]|tara:strand:+ start:2308 stop:3180 length:873 start_codon:yes stop_codon:yes gene_type:complete
MHDLLSQRYWSLLDALWVLAGWAVHEQTQEREVFYSLDRIERLFALQNALEEEIPFDQSCPQHYEDLVFVSIITGEEMGFASTKEKATALVQITETGRQVSGLKKAFEFVANTNFCDAWYSLGKPFHWLSRWDRSYVLSWAEEFHHDLPVFKSLKPTQRFPVSTIIKEFENRNDENDGWQNAKAWRVKKVIHEIDFGPQIQELLSEYARAQLAPPTASDVLDRWREVDTFGIYDVSDSAFRYRRRDGRMSGFVYIPELQLAIKNRVIWLGDGPRFTSVITDAPMGSLPRV